MCIVLGEDLRLLARGGRLEEYIRYGEKQARVKVGSSYCLITQILLRGENSDIEIEVRIHKGSADYFLNGKSVKKDKLKSLRRTLKIDLGNLCQFLPQDRVSDFVNQTPQARLFEFERSVGGEDFVQFVLLFYVVRTSPRTDQFTTETKFDPQRHHSKIDESRSTHKSKPDSPARKGKV